MDGKSCYPHCFNPRICKRCDLKPLQPQYITCVSIHASVKDATTSLWLILSEVGVSIHASVKDATTPVFRTGSTGIVSIHASVKDATNRRTPFFVFHPFQSTHL